MVIDIIKMLRVKHYVKNGFVFIPLFFSLGFLNTRLVLESVFAFIAFCAGSSAVYILNDIFDRKRDASHPVKRKRPIASGRISLKTAALFFLAMLFASTLFSVLINLTCLMVVVAYISVNILYSIKLKSIPILDVACIALGFILRVVMGACAIGVELSQWLILTVIAISFYLGFGKRKNEIARLGNETQTREVLKKYTETFLKQSMNSMMTLTVVFYALWTIDKSVIQRLSAPNLVYTTPIVMLFLLRYSYLLEGDSHGDPTTVILEDKPLIFGGILYAVVILAMIFIG